MQLTAEQLLALMAIVDKHHNAFIANFIGPAALPADTVAKLEAAGLLRPQVQGIRDAFLMGMVGANLPAGGGPTVSYAQMADRLARRPFPLTEAEGHAIAAAQVNAGQYISGLGARVKAQASQAVMKVDVATRAKDADAYRQVVADAVAQRKQIGSVVSDLGHATGDWARDLERVATTEMANALQQGVAYQTKKTFGDQARVAKVSSALCCEACRRAYVDPATGRPRVFLLSELQANGSNYGRKAKDWLPCVEAHHPSCGCTLVSVPPGLEFNAQNLLVPITEPPRVKP